MRLLLMYLFLFFFLFARGQQEQNWSSFYENGFIWNPALTAKWNSWEVAVNHKKEWVEFSDAPQFSNISFQFPLILGHITRTSFGAFLSSDKVGPYSSLNFSGTYTYKMRTRWFGNYDDVLTIGMLGSVSRSQFNANAAIAFNGITGDPIIASEFDNKISPDFSIGAFYNSVSDFYKFDSHYYFGIAVANLYPKSKFELQDGIVRNRMNIYAHGGYRYFPFRAKFYLEPSLFISYTLLRSFNAMAVLRFEKSDQYWISGGVVSSGDGFIQAGVIFAEDSFLKVILNQGLLRIGVKGEYGLGKFRKLSGAGYEMYMAYVYTLE